MAYAFLRYLGERCKSMKNSLQSEIRWQVVKAMLDEFPDLRTKIKMYFSEQSD